MKKNIQGMGFIAMILFTASNLFAQQSTITGTVVDAESGDVLPGVNVVVQGTSTGTSTEADGTYELTVSSDAEVLTFSFVGYEQLNEPIDNRTSIDVELQPEIQAFEEMVVTAFGMEQEEKAVTTISSNACISGWSSTSMDVRLSIGSLSCSYPTKEKVSTDRKSVV